MSIRFYGHVKETQLLHLTIGVYRTRIINDDKHKIFTPSKKKNKIFIAFKYEKSRCYCCRGFPRLSNKRCCNMGKIWSALEKSVAYM